MAPGYYYSESNHPGYGSLDGHYPYPSPPGVYNGLYVFEHTVPADPTATPLSVQHTVGHGSDSLLQVLPIIHPENPLRLPAPQGNAMLLSTEARETYPVQPYVSAPTSCSRTVSHLKLISGHRSVLCRKSHTNRQS